MLNVQDHFMRRHDAILALHQLSVNPPTREARFLVSTGGELMKSIRSHAMLAPLCASIPDSTLRGWFTYSGAGSAAKYPAPKVALTDGLAAGYNVGKRLSSGRPKMLKGSRNSQQRCNNFVLQE